MASLERPITMSAALRLALMAPATAILVIIPTAQTAAHPTVSATPQSIQTAPRPRKLAIPCSTQTVQPCIESVTPPSAQAVQHAPALVILRFVTDIAVS